MIRCTIEMLPGGDASRARTIGLVEITNDGTSLSPTYGNYVVSLKKTSPFAGALALAWRSKKVATDQDGNITKRIDGLQEDDEIAVSSFAGMHRTQRGVYDLLYRALCACGLDRRNP